MFDSESIYLEMSGVSLEVGFDLFIGFGALIMIVNIPMAIFILLHTNLRKQKEVVTIGFVCFADLVNALGYFFAGIYRLEILHNGQENDFWSNINCTHTIFPYLLLGSYQLIGVSTLTITIDRVIAVTVPLKYRTFTWRYAYALVGCNCSFIRGPRFPHMCLLLVLTSTLHCICAIYTSTAYGPEIWNYMIFFRQSSTAASIVMYIPIAVRVAYLRRRSISQKSTIRGANPYRRLIKTTVLIGITLLCEIIFVMIPDLFLNFDLFGLKHYELVWYLFVISKGIINIFLYSLNHEDIKGALFNHFSAGMKQRMASLFSIRDQSTREESQRTRRTQATTITRT